MLEKRSIAVSAPFPLNAVLATPKSRSLFTVVTSTAIFSLAASRASL